MFYDRPYKNGLSLSMFPNGLIVYPKLPNANYQLPKHLVVSGGGKLPNSLVVYPNLPNANYQPTRVVYSPPPRNANW